MLQMFVLLALGALIALPLGNYLFCVAQQRRTLLDPVLDPVEGFIYRICGVDRKGMSWKGYAVNFMVTNVVMMLACFIILCVQAGQTPDLALNTAISFITNTNLQHYSGEQLPLLSQNIVITFLMFTSAASGYSVAVAFMRGVTGKESIGNFYVDLLRIITRVLLPICIVVSLLLIWQGVPQTNTAQVSLTTLEGQSQTIAMGPVASLESIKHIGTNGGGFLGANSATPIENPTPLTNLIELLSMIAMPGACVVVFGRMALRDKTWEPKKKRPLLGNEARPVLLAMSLLLVVGMAFCIFAEGQPNPLLSATGIDQSVGNMEGKETRFGITGSAMFATITTSFTTGSVNGMMDSMTPLGSIVPLGNMMLNLVFGGKGVGLMNMVVYVILTVFVCGLLIGRTPSYIGRRIEGREMALAAICILVHPMLILGGTALGALLPVGFSAVTNPGFHGLSQMLYEFASASANNGSGMEGLADNTVFWNLSTGFVMFVGRFAPILLQLAIAGSLMTKKAAPQSVGTLRTDGATFGLALVMVVVLIAALTFFPVLALGPIAEQFALMQGGI